jgi:hypothetical protein
LRTDSATRASQDTWPADRPAVNQQLFRDVNNRVHDLAIRQLDPPWLERTAYLCECADPGCIGTVELTLNEYESLLEEPRLTAVAPGHEPPSSQVAARTDRFSLVMSAGSARRQV